MKYHFQKVVCCSCAMMYSRLGQDFQMQDTHMTAKLSDLFLLFYHGKRIISGSHCLYGNRLRKLYCNLPRTCFLLVSCSTAGASQCGYSSSPVTQSREDKKLLSVKSLRQISAHSSSKLGHYELPSYEHKCLFKLRYTQYDTAPCWHCKDCLFLSSGNDLLSAVSSVT